MVEIFNQFIDIVGRAPDIVREQLRVNPRLQRTQASGTQAGQTKSTEASINIVQKGIVRLPNRATPLNSNQRRKRKVPRQVASPADMRIVAKQIRRGTF